MPKAKKVVEEKAVEASEETVSSPISGEVAAVVKPEEKKEKKSSKTSFDVHNAGGTYMRTYSVEQHGKDADDLAKEYAKKIGGSVK